jgi:hypothetical protein
MKYSLQHMKYSLQHEILIATDDSDQGFDVRHLIDADDVL